ncbi:MAG TPA: SAM-dependent chlorinase/fluorinase [Anaerolineales bacterium]|nr:SAM-dependent chlorinase/fluorinase [Anaerolineales bacterium]
MMTDFGIKDGNVGVMKGVIWGICPEAQIADISHMIAAQDIREAALILARSTPYFPPGTIHLVVVDPGVGTARRPMAARIGESFYVGPDNGLITLWLEQSRHLSQDASFIVLDRPTYWRPDVSRVFHGRDIFAPVAAYLARGLSLQELGSELTDPVLLQLPRPRPIAGGLEGEIIHIDHFGNAASNIMLDDIRPAMGDARKVQVRLGPTQIAGIVGTFGERSSGEVVALFGSTGNLIVSVVNGSAAAELHLKVGDAIRVELAGRPDERDGVAA